MFTVCLCPHAFFNMVLELAGALGRRLGTPEGSTWASSGHLGGTTVQGKRTDDKTWCAMVMGFLESLIIVWFYEGICLFS